MPSATARIVDLLSGSVDRLAPRLLTQICRDPTSPTYGACDRNWWHYKIRDFPSIILQQTGYSLACLSELPQYADRRERLRQLAAASCRFWNWRAQKYGAFEEYYPWEQGYPPLAFSTLAVAKLAVSGIVCADEVGGGLQVAARQLLNRFESSATNQQCAGLAALAWLRRIELDWVPIVNWSKLCERTLASQHPEGWFMEYGGPDLGYLSVSLDCLWDAYDASGDSIFADSAAKALAFIASFVFLPGRGAGMHNARNTDYIVPYGIARFLLHSEYAQTAMILLDRLYGCLDHPGHFLHAVDDRYLGHYIGHSLIRAIPLLQAFESRSNDPLRSGPRSAEDHRSAPAIPCPDGEQTDENKDVFPGFGEPSPDSAHIPDQHLEPALGCAPSGTAGGSMHHYFEGTGHWLLRATPSGCEALISGKKGGVLTLWFGDRTVSDYGWTISRGKRVWVSHWWMDEWSIAVDEENLQMTVRGFLTPHSETISGPWQHLVLRLISLLFGRRIIAVLKQRMIFKHGARRTHPFERRIIFAPGRVRVIDHIDFAQGGMPERASRSSKRHVASADSFHVEDLILMPAGIERRERRAYREGRWEIETVYACAEKTEF